MTADTKSMETKTGTRGREFVGTVISARMQKTVTVEWERRKYIQKYERYLKARTRIKAHNPSTLAAEEGDVVRIRECRPLSKTKSFVVVEKLGKDYFTLERAKRAYEAVDKVDKEEKKDRVTTEANDESR